MEILSRISRSFNSSNARVSDISISEYTYDDIYRSEENSSISPINSKEINAKEIYPINNENNEPDNIPSFTIAILGDENVGKSELVNVLLSRKNYKDEPYMATHGIKKVVIPSARFGNMVANVVILECSTQYKYTNQKIKIITDADLCIILGSMSNENSIKEMKFWKTQVKFVSKDTPIVKVINLDVPKYNLIKELKTTMSKKYRKYHFISIKSGRGVIKLMSVLGYALQDTLEEDLFSME
jgi:tRNA U34 5-carboxymethylaminomethyl modifying GTPase MnmE/TrmE